MVSVVALVPSEFVKRGVYGYDCEIEVSPASAS